MLGKFTCKARIKASLPLMAHVRTSSPARLAPERVCLRMAHIYMLRKSIITFNPKFGFNSSCLIGNTIQTRTSSLLFIYLFLFLTVSLSNMDSKLSLLCDDEVHSCQVRCSI